MVLAIPWFMPNLEKEKVISIDNGTRDYMVTVTFDEYGLKKMLAGFAKLKKA